MLFPEVKNYFTPSTLTVFLFGGVLLLNVKLTDGTSRTFEKY